MPDLSTTAREIVTQRRRKNMTPHPKRIDDGVARQCALRDALRRNDVSLAATYADVAQRAAALAPFTQDVVGEQLYPYARAVIAVVEALAATSAPIEVCVGATIVGLARRREAAQFSETVDGR